MFDAPIADLEDDNIALEQLHPYLHNLPARLPCDVVNLASTPSISVAPVATPSEESQWFKEQIQPHEAQLRSWLLARFPSLTETDDLVQECYLRLIRARQTGKIENPKGYLFTIAFNAALDFFRRKNIVIIDQVEEMAGLALIEEQANTLEVVSRNEEVAILHEAIRALPTRCRQVFTLRKLYGMSHREIALKLGLSEKTVEEQINRAMRRCAAFFRKRGLP